MIGHIPLNHRSQHCDLTCVNLRLTGKYFRELQTTYLIGIIPRQSYRRKCIRNTRNTCSSTLIYIAILKITLKKIIHTNT